MPAAPSQAPVEGELSRALAGVVDLAEWPDEAAALEERPYSMLLDRVRLGPEGPTLGWVAAEDFTYEGVLADPDRFRGRVVYTERGIIAEIGRLEAPGVGRADRHEVYGGILASLGRAGAIRLWSFRVLRRRGDALLYPGDRVDISGYFFKIVPVIDALGETHRMPLVVGPWPTYAPRNPDLPRWAPLGEWLKRAPDLAAMLPTREVPHETVRSRLVLDVGPDGAFSFDGVRFGRGAVLNELRRYARTHPGRAAVLRARDDRGRDACLCGGRQAGREILAEAGIERFDVKALPEGAGPP